MWGKMLTCICTDTRHGQALVFTHTREGCAHACACTWGKNVRAHTHTHMCILPWHTGTQEKGMNLCPCVPGECMHTCTEGKHVLTCMCVHRGRAVLVCTCRKGYTLTGERRVCMCTPVHTHGGGHTHLCTHAGEGTHACAHTWAVPLQKAACQGGRQRVRARRAGVKAAARVKWGVRARPGASAAQAACSPSVPLMPSVADSPARAAAARGWGSSARQNH